MRFSWSRVGATAILGLFVAASAGCTLVNKIRAKNELNETAKAYKEGHFDVAEQHAKRALALDPTNPTAPIFIARDKNWSGRIRWIESQRPLGVLFRHIEVTFFVGLGGFVQFVLRSDLVDQRTARRGGDKQTQDRCRT